MINSEGKYTKSHPCIVFTLACNCKILGIDILGIDILGVDILGVDILGRTQVLHILHVSAIPT